MPGAASDARRAVHAVAEGRVAAGYEVALAVSEAVNNVVVHAYRDRQAGTEPGRVHVAVTLERDALVVAVSDEGTGMKPRTDSPGAGLGLPIIATLADRVEVDRLANGTRLVMAFRLADAHRAAGEVAERADLRDPPER